MLLEFDHIDFQPDMLTPSSKWEKSIIDFIKKWNESENFSVQTSGSTGKPKTIFHSKESMIKSALLTGAYFGLKQGSTALMCLPPDKIAGIMMLVRAIVLKLKLYCVLPSASPLYGIDEPIGFAAMVPLQVKASLEKLGLIEKLLIGGADVSSQLTQKLQNLSTQAFLSYGMTETITHIAIRRLNGKYKTSFFETLPSVNISTDERNCLQIQAPHISSQTISTNDVVQVINNTHFEWQGRYDSVINSGGIKIIPEVLEKNIQNLIDTPFGIAGTPHSILGEQVTLFIEGTKWKDSKLAQLKDKLRKKLRKYEVPRQIFFIQQLPRTSNGKLIRSNLLAPQ